jgi:hypothetical protein
MKHLKFLLSILPFIAMFWLNNSNAESSPGNIFTCTPSTTNNYVACDAGYTGQKFTVTTKTCPDGWPNGIIKTTSTFNTNQCKKNQEIFKGDRTCELTPSACAQEPSAPGCPANMHWTLTGSSIAHCVQNDPGCGWGTSLVHDGLGNPSCVANTCPANQVLQSNGSSCACPSGTAWNGSSCIALPPPCMPSAVNSGNVACGAGFTGSKHGVTTTSCPGSVVTFAWDTSACLPIAVPPPCTPSAVNGGNVACGAGFTGSKFLVTTNACPGNIISSVWNSSACSPITPPSVCTNGAANFPTCTLYFDNLTASGLCITNLCQINYANTIRNQVKANASILASNNADLASVINQLYDACPLGSGWNYSDPHVVSGPVSGDCLTDGEPFLYKGKLGRMTEWTIHINGIPQ